MKTTRRILLVAALAAAAFRADAATPTKHEALVAIEVLEKNVTGPEAKEAARTVMTYAQDSDDVMVNIGQNEVPWVGEKWGLESEQELSFQSVLLAAFVAGNVRSQIKNDRAEDDTYSGWIFAIKTYARLRAKAPFRSASLDQLTQMQAEGTLLRHAREVQQQDSKDDDSQTPRKPFARAPLRPPGCATSKAA